jgi:inositol-phosphate phosphatase/L-galactose 1-phosphate phosphatase/histidinol-phosphatase
MQPQDELLTFALFLADTAAVISRRYFRHNLSIDTKAGNFPVTQADREIEATLRRLINEKYPSHAIIGEEYESKVGSDDYAWVIDPIDGTVAFTTGKPTFTTLIALTKNGKAVFGIIDQPISRERFIGVDNYGAYLTVGASTKITTVQTDGPDSKQALPVVPISLLSTFNLPLKTSQINSLSQARLNATTPYMFNPEEMVWFNKLKDNVRVCSWGGDAYAYALLASGHIDLIMESQLQYYDVAAVAPIIEASGGIISTWQGEPITPQFTGQCLASANYELHNLALKIINIKGCTQTDSKCNQA